MNIQITLQESAFDAMRNQITLRMLAFVVTQAARCTRWITRAVIYTGAVETFSKNILAEGHITNSSALIIIWIHPHVSIVINGPEKCAVFNHDIKHWIRTCSMDLESIVDLSGLHCLRMFSRHETHVSYKHVGSSNA